MVLHQQVVPLGSWEACLHVLLEGFPKNDSERLWLPMSSWLPSRICLLILVEDPVTVHTYKCIHCHLQLCCDQLLWSKHKLTHNLEERGLCRRRHHFSLCVRVFVSRFWPPGNHHIVVERKAVKAGENKFFKEKKKYSFSVMRVSQFCHITE